jgi:photosystem II stability/assembly factor-like uncharacterized protein
MHTEPDVIYALALAPGTTICFAAKASGLAMSRDGGASWEPVTLGGAQPLPVYAVAVSPGFASDRLVIAGLAGAMARSLDGGEHWTLQPLPTPPPVITGIGFSPHYVEDGTIFASSLEDGVFCSRDRAGHWLPTNFGLLDLHVLCLAVSPDYARDRSVYLGTESGLFHSTNEGRAWREVPFPAGYMSVSTLIFSPDFAQDHTLWMGTEAGGLWKSADRGQSWRQLSTGLFTESVDALLAGPHTLEGQVLLAVHDGALWTSTDGGESWFQALSEEHNILAMAAPDRLSPTGRLLLGTAKGEVIAAPVIPADS